MNGNEKKNWIVHISERTQTFFFPQDFLLTWNTRVPSDIKYPVVMGRFKNITCVCGFCRSLLISPIFRVYRIRNDCQRSNVRRTLILDKTVKNSRHFKLHLLRWMINLKKLRLLLNQQNERELWLIANFKLYLRKFRLWITLPNGWQNHKILSCLWTQRKKEGKNSYLSMSAFWLAQTLISFQCKWHVTEAADGISWLSCVPREPYVLLVQNVPRVKAWSHSVARV